MNRNALVVSLVLFALVGSASATPVIYVGQISGDPLDRDVKLLPDTSGQIVQVFVTGSDPVQGLNLFAQVGDGGPELSGYGLAAGEDGPAITALILKPAGGVFGGITDNQQNLPGIPQVANSTITYLSGGGATLSADGLLAEIVIDTTGFTEGTCDLLVGGVLPGFGGYHTDFGGISATIYNGTITVPEPMSMSLLALGGLAMIRRRRRA